MHLALERHVHVERRGQLAAVLDDVTGVGQPAEGEPVQLDGLHPQGEGLGGQGVDREWVVDEVHLGPGAIDVVGGERARAFHPFGHGSEP